MTTPSTEALPSFFQRLPLAFGAFFSVLGNPSFAARVLALRQPATATPATAPVTAPVAATKPAAPPPLKEATPDAALQLLGLLQRDARLIDFTQEDLSQYSDLEIGGVARVLHEGCCKVLREHFTLVPVRPEAEGNRLTLPAGFDARAVRLTGNVVGQAPFTGTLCHRGWRATETRLPQLADKHDVTVLAQAEVEL
jgi:hypothetical protein